jgi:Na+-driven multidrug efflux pump
MLLAMGLPQLTTAIAAVVTVTSIPLLIWWTSVWGALGAAWAVTVAAAVAVVFNFVIVVRAVGVSARQIAAAVWRSVGALAVMGSVVMVVNGSMAVGDAAALAAAAMAGAASYIGAHLVLWQVSGRPPGPERQVLELLKGRFASRRFVVKD